MSAEVLFDLRHIVGVDGVRHPAAYPRGQLLHAFIAEQRRHILVGIVQRKALFTVAADHAGTLPLIGKLQLQRVFLFLRQVFVHVGTSVRWHDRI